MHYEYAVITIPAIKWFWGGIKESPYFKGSVVWDRSILSDLTHISSLYLKWKK